MEDNLITCPKSGGNACYYINNNGHEAWYSYSCGYSSDSTKVLGSLEQEAFEEVLPQLYKELRWINPADNLVWYPTSYNKPEVGMVFADGTGVDDWKWSAVLAVPIPAFEKSKYPKGSQYKMDMRTMQQFDDYIEALDYIGYFKQ